MLLVATSSASAQQAQQPSGMPMNMNTAEPPRWQFMQDGLFRLMRGFEAAVGRMWNTRMGRPMTGDAAMPGMTGR